MKTSFTYSLLAAVAACSLAQAQTAYTTPVGYITHNVSSLGGDSALTILGPTLVQPSVFTGVPSSAPSGATANFTGSVPANLDGTYVLEITSGANEGWWSTVVSSTATSITVADAFPANLQGAGISVRKHNTLQTFLGENNPGLITSDGVTGDEVQILNPDQSLTVYAYLTADVTGDGDDWYDLATGNIANDTIIYPGSAIIIKSSSPSPLSFVSVGQVKVTKTQVDLVPGLTLIAQCQAAGGSYNSMDLQNQLIPLNADASNSDFDEFQILNPDQSLSAHSAADAAIFGSVTMVDLAAGADSGLYELAEGVGAIIKRNESQPASTITLSGTNLQ